MRRLRVLAIAAASISVVSVSVVACGGDGDDGASVPASSTDIATGSTGTAEQRFPDVIGADATIDTDGTWTFAVTISSPYDTPERYADAWRIVGPDGTVLGERVLLHDHASEQPFTRSLNGVEIDDGIDIVTIEGRDQRYGYGGNTLDLELDRTTT